MLRRIPAPRFFVFALDCIGKRISFLLRRCGTFPFCLFVSEIFTVTNFASTGNNLFLCLPAGGPLCLPAIFSNFTVLRGSSIRGKREREKKQEEEEEKETRVAGNNIWRKDWNRFGKHESIHALKRGGARKVCAFVEQSVPSQWIRSRIGRTGDIPSELNSAVIRGTLRQWNVIHARRYDDIVLRRL